MLCVVCRGQIKGENLHRSCDVHDVMLARPLRNCSATASYTAYADQPGRIMLAALVSPAIRITATSSCETNDSTCAPRSQNTIRLGTWCASSARPGKWDRCHAALHCGSQRPVKEARSSWLQNPTQRPARPGPYNPAGGVTAGLKGLLVGATLSCGRRSWIIWPGWYLHGAGCLCSSPCRSSAQVSAQVC